MPTTPSKDSGPSLERTLAVLYGPEQSEFRSEVESRLMQAGFLIVAEARLVAEEIEEAGIDVDDIQDRGENCLHVALVLERKSAVAVWKELMGEGRAKLNKDSLASKFPTLKLSGSPSAAAAQMSIATLFPHLANEFFSPVAARTMAPSSASQQQQQQQPTNDAPSPARHVPFALSNLAHPSPKPTKAELSPSVARALKKLEMREEEDERRRSGAYDPEPDPEDGNDVGSARMFTYHSQDSTMEYGTEDPHHAAVDGDAYGDDDDDQHSLLDDESSAQDDEDPATQEVLDALDADELEALSQARVIDAHIVLAPSASARVSSLASLASPRIQPRLTKAAALRLGIALPTPPPRTPRMREASIQSSRSNDSTPSASVESTPRLKSLGQPTIMPRGTKTSLRRTNADGSNDAPLTAVKIRREAVGTAARSQDPLYEDIPGYKRRHSIQVASTARPQVEPRMTKAAMLRAGIEIPAPRQRAASVDDHSPTRTVAPVARSTAIKSTAPPLIAPRGTKSSNLRAGVETQTPPTLSRHQTLENVAEEGGAAGGQKQQRRESVQLPVKRPAFEVRLTKTAAMRTGVTMEDNSPALRRQASTTSASSDGNEQSSNTGYEGVPGHKRRESIQVASTARPTIEPRMSKAAMLRAGMDIPMTAAERRASTTLVPTTTFDGVPGHSRRESLAAPVVRPPSIQPRLNKSAMLRTGRDPLSASVPVSHLQPSPSLSRTSSNISATLTISAPAPKVAPRQPTIVPRSNKSAELRAAKKQKEQDDLALVANKRSSMQLPRRPATSQGVLMNSVAANGGR
ncbi:hypothetical protein RQP46_001874 [Phenoliferia psychrophenolica]